jgi:AcrR family transcriptional regulator
LIEAMLETTIEPVPSEDTTTRIVNAAERLFIRDGIDATSLRAVTREAGVNVAAIHYYFGSRDELLRAVLDRIVTPVNERRLVLLDQALAANKGRPLGVEEILRIFLLPDLEAVERLRDRGVEIAHFVARAYAAPSPTLKRLIEEQFGECSSRFLAELARALPAIDRAELEFRFLCIVSVIVRLFGAATPRGITGGMDTADIASALDRIVGFLAPGLAAPISSPPNRSKRIR